MPLKCSPKRTRRAGFWALMILADEAIPALVRVSVFHFLFAYIHPFYDGNGRTNRFISSYVLSRSFSPIVGYRLSYSVIRAYRKILQRVFDLRASAE